MNLSTTASSSKAEDLSALQLDDLRRASWLKSKYSESVWLVTDTDDDHEPLRIHFEYRLADGRCLTEVEGLYATVKEYAWFVRDPRFSKIDTAVGHVGAANLQRSIAHALTLRGIWSYSHVQNADIEELVQELRFGADCVLHASERVAELIDKIETDPDARKSRYKGFPVARTVAGFSKNMIDTSQLLAQCNLPDSAKVLPRVAWHVAKAAIRNGMAPPKKDSSEVIPPQQNVTKQQLQRSLAAIDLLFAIRHHAKCDVPRFRPFPDGVMKVANQYGVDPQPTPVPPPKLVLHLLESSAKWVGTYSQPLVACLTELETSHSLPAAEVQASIERCQAALPAHVRNRLCDQSGSKGFLSGAVEMLATACWVLIAAFSARRYEETLDLDEAFLVGSDEEGWWLDCFISKTTRKRELIPVPLVVARAVQTLLAISRTARAGGVNSIYCWLAPQSLKDRRALREYSPRSLLNTYAALVGTPLPNDGTSSWHWIPRQFRRFFAVLYFYRFEEADIAVLSYFLRHFDIETTRGYVTRDPEVAKIWREAERDYVLRLADSIISGEREYSGAMGDRLKKIAKLITSRLEKRLIVATESAGDRLMTIMERGGLVVTPKAWVTCTCPRTHVAAKKARCRAGHAVANEIVGPSYADAGPSVCGECRWALIDPSKAHYAGRTQSHLEASINSGRGTGTLFGELERAHLVELSRVNANSYGRAHAKSRDKNDD